FEPRRPKVQQATAPLGQRPTAVDADRPADDRAEQVAERARQREDNVRPRRRDDLRPEEDRVLARERARGDRAPVDPHQPARRRVRIEPTTFAGWVSRKRATTPRRARADFGATLTKPSVSLTQKPRSIEESRARSSVAFTTQRQRPSTACARCFSERRVGQVT